MGAGKEQARQQDVVLTTISFLLRSKLDCFFFFNYCVTGMACCCNWFGFGFRRIKKTFLSLLGWGQVLRGNTDETDAALLCGVDSG